MLTVDEQITIMQDNLQYLRKIAGWTAEQLGNNIGVTKQTISNLENKKVQMTKTQYIAIRSVFVAEGQRNKQNTTLSRVMKILFDADSAYSAEQYAALQGALLSISASAAAGIVGLQLWTVATMLLAPLHLGLAGAAISKTQSNDALDWLVDIINKGKDNR